MLYRCKSVSQKYWNGKGIKVCKKWNKFENFLLDMGDRPAGTSLDRINSKGNYNKKNCRWADGRTQQSNKSTTRFHSFNGKKHTLIEWSEILGVKRSCLAQRFYCLKWPIDKVLTYKLNSKEPKK